MNEFDLINKIKPKYYKQPTLIKGIGDDGAVFNSQCKQTVIAVDTFVENIHFTEETMSMFHVGYRSLAAAVSDLAAMGAMPAFYLASVILPTRDRSVVYESIFRGMDTFAAKYKMDLIGGDTVSGSVLALSITVIGYVEKNKIHYRHHAKNHDIVFVTGTLGDSQAGLYLLQNKKTVSNGHYFIKRHQQPEPRVNFAQQLTDLKRVSLNDISDGIVNELYEIAEASKVNLLIDESLIPKHKDLMEFPKNLVNEWIYYGGEDFELVGTVPEKDWKQVKLIASQTNTPVTKIGSVNNTLHKSIGKVFLKKDDSINLLNRSGYIHFE